MKCFIGVTLVVLVTCCALVEMIHQRQRYRRIPITEPTTPRPNIRQRVANRIMRHREKTTTRVCYDEVGCFDVPHSRSPLQRSPEAPEMLDTKFYLFRRNIKFSEPNILLYDDNGTSLATSKFNPQQPLKIYIHGYMSRWNDKGIFLMADAFLKLSDCNVIIMDWSKGSRGPQYASAAANTEVVGRQLGILLLSIIEKGLNPKDIHLIGFSLGAHVAGCAAELIKSRGMLLGRISGLDAAGPLFRHNHLKEKSKKLDKSDAKFVDVLHTDCSPTFVDGFGLWEPIGHVDYFANGGQEQPGCNDRHASVVFTTLEGGLNKDRACSHIRAVHLYLESLLNKVSNNTCEFIAYKCPGGLSTYQSGQCFAQIEDKRTNPLALDAKYLTDFGKMGAFAKGDGVMYFATKGTSLYCGTQLQVSVFISQKTPLTKGILHLKLQHGDYSTSFNINCEVSESLNGIPFYGISTAEYNSITPKMETIVAYVSYTKYEFKDNNTTIAFGDSVYLNKINLKDINTNSWNYCGGTTLVGQGPTTLKLSRKECL